MSQLSRTISGNFKTGMIRFFPIFSASGHPHNYQVTKKSWFSPIKARLLCSCAGGGSPGFNSDDADESEFVYDKVKPSFNGSPMATEATILPAQLYKNIAGNLKTGVKSRFSPIWNQLSESDHAQATCYSPMITRLMCSSGGGGIPSFNIQDSAERIAFYNKVKTRFLIDPRDPEYLKYLLDPSPKPEDKSTSAYVHNLARKCLIGTQASLLPIRIEQFHASEEVKRKARPDLIARAKRAVENQAPYIYDPGYIHEFLKVIAARKTPAGKDYTKYLAANLMVTHVCGDSAGEHHRFIEFISGREATAIDYYPPHEFESYCETFRRIMSRNFNNCKSYEDEFEKK